MFNLAKKGHAAVDVKKSIQKILDTKKDSATRLKHLRIILENVDLVEARYIFETHYSHIYYLFYDVFAATEAGVKIKPHRVHREDVESVLYILEHILLLLPELLQQRWQLHSLTRVMRTLLHPGNILRLRREAMRMFVIWFQEVGEQASEELLAIFATLVPGFPAPASQQTAPRPPRAHPDHKLVGPVDVVPILPPQGSEKTPDDLTRFFLECLMDNMVTQLTRIEWKDKANHVRCFNFLFDNFKQFYLPHIFPDFNWHTNLYKPALSLPEMRRQLSPMASSVDGAPRPADRLVACRVVVIRWVANFVHAPLSRRGEQAPSGPGPGHHGQQSGGSGGSGDDGSQGTPETRRSVPPAGGGPADGEAPTSLHSLASDSSGSAFYPVDTRERDADRPDESALVRDVLFGSRQNVNFVHEVFRQAFLLSCHYSAAIKRVVLVYKDWIQMNVQLPAFLLEPSDTGGGYDGRSPAPGEDVGDLSRSRHRADGSGGPSASVRAGLQNTLQLFITNSANIFLLEASPEYRGHYLEDQVELCKRILNMYRYLVMNVYMSQRTWEQLLLVLLQVTTQTLSGEPTQRAREQTLGAVLARPLFQTLIVTWVKANLNVSVSVELWDQFLAALTSLTAWEELIKEWAKTLETLTRVVARQVYDLDLNNLPLDRLTEQKSKRRRGRGEAQDPAAAWSRPSVPAETRDHGDGPGLGVGHNRNRRASLQPPDDGRLHHGSGGSHPGVSPHSRKRCTSGLGPAGGPPHGPGHAPPRLVRSLSEGSLAPSLLAGAAAAAAACRPLPLHEAASRKVSRSMNSLRGRVSLYSQTSEAEYRSRSPSPSSGLETNSIKESPMGLDLFGADGNSIDTIDSGGSEHRSVMSGGTLRGWMPDVAVVLWRRMLGALGNVNHIQSPTVHAQVFDYLIELSETLVKIEENLGVSADNQSTWWPSELVPPLPLLVPWCLEALRLPDSHQAGRLRALRLLCLLLVRRQPAPVSAAVSAQLLRALHRGLSSGRQDVIHTLVRQCGPGLLATELPAASLLVLDLIQACGGIAASQELQGVPRTESVSILGSLVCFPNRWPQLEALQPRPLEMTVVPCPELKDCVVSVLLKAGRREPSVTARCTALVSLAIYLYEELTHATMHDKIKDAIHILLSALKCNSRIVGQVAADMLVLLTDHAAILLQYLPDVPKRIIEVTAATLEALVVARSDPPPDERWLLVSLVFCLGEWCMRLPIDVLTETDQQGKSLLLRVFKALTDCGASDGPPPAPPPPPPPATAHPQPPISLTVTDPYHQVLHVVVGDSPPAGSLSADSVDSRSSGTVTGDAAPLGTVKLAARAVISHLVNHLDHFPMLSGAVRLGSLVSEHDDLPMLTASDELSSDIFYAPNVQFFVLNNRSLLSLVELPSLDVPGGGVTAGLCTAHSQVRVILRDLAGKFCWDASVLYGTDGQLESLCAEWAPRPVARRSAPPMVHGKSEESLLGAAMVAPPRFTVRHRGRGTLPSWQDTEGDMDNLDDLLLYLADTSPECVATTDAVSLLPSVLGQERHVEAINALLNQRSAELEAARTADTSAPAPACRPPAPQPAGSPFQHGRLLFSQLGLTGWSRRPHIHLLRKSERLLRELRNVDNQKCRETHKIAVIYVALGQEDKRSILANSAGSQMFEEFIAGLAWEVELETHTGFMGGLQRNGATGDTAPYYATSFTECLFHVSTRMPSHSEEAILQKTRHLGNDEVHVVWSEHKRDYRRGIIPTEFCDVLIVIYPLESGLFRIQLDRKPEVPFFGPLFNGAIVGRKILPGLVRATALNASRAKRSMLPYYLNFFEERSQALETLISNHRESSTFEELVGSVYSPAPPVPGGLAPRPAQEPVSRVGSEPPLTSALVDATPQRSPWHPETRNHRADPDSGMAEIELGKADPSPKTLKRLSFKTTVRKASSSIQETIQGLPTAARSHLPVSRTFQTPTTPPDSPAQRFGRK
ncbi:ral GTPase-activating protein subunit alpha-1-like [Amphibalanus amphitrite]|uniref:ral GTPase-activating protein subunit alpha-1-like n=1 Tax=Amphibalanus amphitrite TaxID=1232801 RepID=UPI001C909447|nr:ral GTPase-activating protein subunit alpha-1-like [Amphibalanus amphitrite]